MLIYKYFLIFWRNWLFQRQGQGSKKWVFMDFLNFEDGGTIRNALAAQMPFFLVHKIAELPWILNHTQFFASHHYDYVEISLHENNRQILCNKILLRLLSKSLQLLWLTRKVSYLRYKSRFSFCTYLSAVPIK